MRIQAGWNFRKVYLQARGRGLRARIIDAYIASEFGYLTLKSLRQENPGLL